MSPVSSMKLYARGRSFVRFWRGVTRCLKIKMDDYMALLLLLLLHGIAYAYLLLVEEQARRRRRFWVRPWIARRDEPDLPNMADFYEELISDGDTDEFRATMRMSVPVYKLLLDLLTPSLTKQHTNFRSPIPAKTRLKVTLRYLALGDGFRSLSQQFRLGHSTVREIVQETCWAIRDVLQGQYLRTPCSRQEWLDISAAFQQRWNMVHCLGAVDGKHIRIVQPRRSGSLYFNYKGYHSIVLLAIASADYEFLYVDIGAEGRASDGGTWRKCTFHDHLYGGSNLLDIPHARHVPGMQQMIPYFLVGDDAFRMTPHLLKPFPGLRLSRKQEIFNYRLSRCRRVVENTFGILTTRFRIFTRAIEVSPEFVKDIVLACCVLHNFLRKEGKQEYLPQAAVDHEQADGHIIPGQWRQDGLGLDSIQRDSARNVGQQAKNLRLALADYFLTPAGEIRWQYRRN